MRPALARELVQELAQEPELVQKRAHYLVASSDH